MPDRIAEQTHDEALNDFYWNSSRTIDEIVDELGVGRNTLYSTIRPQPTGMNCQTCGDGIVYTNRTNRASGTGTCVVCQKEVTVSADAHPGGAVRPGSEPKTSREPVPGRWRADFEAVEHQRMALIGGAAVLGIAVGVAAAATLRR
ncbi:MAG: hypothetical protein WD737_07450 [Gemmatimonadota bacterium]